MYPDARSMDDVAPWFLPSEVQKSVPHPVVIDLLPWPQLRNYLCLNQNRDQRHSVLIYFSSVRLAWPPDQSIIIPSRDGQFTFNPELETIAGNLESWYMTGPWLQAFPHLVKYLAV